jgi:mevalonate kinase
MKGPLFYSKILLFGEYGIIKDSKGLSIPYNFYNGALKVDENPSEKLLNQMKVETICCYLEQLQNEQPIGNFQLRTFKTDVSEECISIQAFHKVMELEVVVH